MGKLRYEVIPGGLSEEHHAQIIEFAEKGWSHSRIAQRLQKHPGTVYWFMLKEGLVVPRYRKAAPYLRAGRVCRPYGPDEDALITALRVQDYAPKEIARLANLRFGNERSTHGVAVRLVMLAAMEAA
jgi:hypothetical protein